VWVSGWDSERLHWSIPRPPEEHLFDVGDPVVLVSSVFRMSAYLILSVEAFSWLCLVFLPTDAYWYRPSHFVAGS